MEANDAAETISELGEDNRESRVRSRAALTIRGDGHVAAITILAA